MNDQYLWDRTGESDPEIQSLENLLSTMQWRERPLHLPTPTVARFALLRWALAPAIAVALLVTGVFWSHLRRHELRVIAVEGSAQISGHFASLRGLRPGDWIRTSNNSRAEIQLADIGQISLGSDSELSVIQSRDTRRHLALRYGSLHARISALPGVFVVDAPAARAVDLGCEYDLNVDRQGNGTLRVSAGWVMLSYLYDQSLVPEGAEALVREGGLLSPSYFEDASAEFKSALERFTVNPGISPSEKVTALQTLLRSARKRDAYTLINLFRRSTAEERVLIYDRLNELVPVPAGITRDGIAHADLNYLDPWWKRVTEELGLSHIKKQHPISVGLYSGFDGSQK